MPYGRRLGTLFPDTEIAICQTNFQTQHGNAWSTGIRSIELDAREIQIKGALVKDSLRVIAQGFSEKYTVQVFLSMGPLMVYLFVTSNRISLSPKQSSKRLPNTDLLFSIRSIIT